MRAEQFLRQGADVLAERGKEYDKPEGERSMARTVAAFQAITGKELTEAEGWLFMQVLKDVRQWQNPDRYHEDSAVDGVNYSALKAEALSEQSSIDAVMRVSAEKSIEISNRGRDAIVGKPSWDDAPENATHLMERLGRYSFANFCDREYLDCDDESVEFIMSIGRFDEKNPWRVVEPRPTKEA